MPFPEAEKPSLCSLEWWFVRGFQYASPYSDDVMRRQYSLIYNYIYNRAIVPTYEYSLTWNGHIIN